MEIIDPVSALKMVYENNEKLKKVINILMKDYSISINDIGVIGSAALGATKIHDYDIILYGEKDKLKEYKKVLDRHLQKDEEKCYFDELYAPFMYMQKDECIDLLFGYRLEKPFSPIKPEIIKENMEFEVEVISDEWAYGQFPIYIVESNEIKYDNLCLGLLSAVFRMLLKKGDKIKGVGSLVKYALNGEIKNMILCMLPEEQNENYNQYFPKKTT